MSLECSECQAWKNFIQDHGWDKCRIRLMKGDPDPTDAQVQDFEDAAVLYYQHLADMHFIGVREEE